MSQRTKDPLISVVMSAYNAEEYLDEAIVSILNQSFVDFEFIIIDDGSKDKTGLIIQKYSSQDSRIKPIIYKNNKGLIAALNDGFKRAKGKYIARMDADDISLPDRLEKQFMYMETNGNVVVLGTQAAYMDESGVVYGIEPFLMNDQELRIQLAIRSGQFRHGAMIIRSSVIREHDEFYNPKALYYEDYEYWARLLRHGEGANMPDILYYYRVNPMSITSTKRPDMVLGVEKVRRRERKRLKICSLGISGIRHIIKPMRHYRPASVYLDGKRLKTRFRWLYQSYVCSLARLYFSNKEYSSFLICITLAFAMQPIRFINEIIIRYLLLGDRTRVL